MSNWKKYKLGDLCTEISYGYTESAVWEPIGPKFLRITDIQDNHISWDLVPHCKINDKEKEKYKLNIGDIVIARTGNSTGATAIIKDDVEAVFASYLIKYKINSQIAFPFYVGHILKSKQWKEFVSSIRGGSAQPGANAKQFAEFPITLPSLVEQQAITEILTALDDKIELNLQMNKTLEEMANTLYKHWFVDFVPFKDGKFVESDMGMIPGGWSIKDIKEITHVITKGTTPTTLKKQFVQSGINFVKVESIQENGTFLPNKFAFIDHETDQLLNRSRIKKDDILITIAGTIGRVAIVTDYILPANTNQAVGILRPNINLVSPVFLMITLKQLRVREQLFSNVVESVQANLSLGVIGSTKLLIPNINDVKVRKAFETLTELYATIEQNTKEASQIIQARDYLLPKLISGEVRVKEAQKKIKELV